MNNATAEEKKQVMRSIFNKNLIYQIYFTKDFFHKKKHYTFINICTLYTIRNKNHVTF